TTINVDRAIVYIRAVVEHLCRNGAARKEKRRSDQRHSRRTRRGLRTAYCAYLLMTTKVVQSHAEPRTNGIKRDDPARVRISGPPLALALVPHADDLVRTLVDVVTSEPFNQQWRGGEMGVSFRTGQAAVAIASLVLLGACGDKDFENIVIVQPV